MKRVKHDSPCLEATPTFTGTLSMPSYMELWLDHRMQPLRKQIKRLQRRVRVLEKECDK